MTDLKAHWDNVYATKSDHQMSWTQMAPTASLYFLEKADGPLTAPIIDIGGGNSRLVDALIDAGYKDVTVLDISGEALDRSSARLGPRAQGVHWVVSNILDYTPPKKFWFWHDRAVFHFLTKPADIKSYAKLAADSLELGGILVIGTFALSGPEKCSGLPVCRYSPEKMDEVFGENFIRLEVRTEVHATPFDTNQDFVFCLYKRK